MPAPVRYLANTLFSIATPLYLLDLFIAYYWSNSFPADIWTICSYWVMFMYFFHMSCRWCWLLMDPLVLGRGLYATPSKHWNNVGMTRNFLFLSLFLPNCSSCVLPMQRRYWAILTVTWYQKQLSKTQFRVILPVLDTCKSHISVNILGWQQYDSCFLPSQTQTIVFQHIKHFGFQQRGCHFTKLLFKK